MMRFAVLTALIAVSLASAQTPRTAGCTNATGTAGLFANTTSPCAQQTACETSFITCIGTGAVVNCTLAAFCVGARITCLNAAAANTTGCIGLNGVQLSLLKVASGQQLFNESDAYKSCAATACRWLNSTFSGAGSDCTLDFDILCNSPVVEVATLILRGNFTAIMANTIKRQAFADAIARDLSRAFRVVVRIRRMFIAGSRRQVRQQTLIIEFEAVGVTGRNPAFNAAFQATGANLSAYLTETAASYLAFTGEAITFVSMGTRADNSLSGPTTPRPTNSPTTTSQVPPPTPAPTRAATPAPTVRTSSGSLARSLAAAMVAVISALVI